MDRSALGDEWVSFLAQTSDVNMAEQAARASAVYFCCSIIAEAVGSLQSGFVDARNNAVSLSMGEVIGLEPNPMQTAAEFWASMAYTAALRGIAFAEPTVGLDNVELWPLDPRGTSVTWRDRSFSVDYTADGVRRQFVPQQLFWFSGLADSTAKPLVPWQQAKGSIEFALALELGARSFFKNNLRFAGMLSTDHKLTDESIAHLREGIARWKNGGIPVLEQGLTFSQTQGTNADAQTTELIKQRTMEMARYWHIPRSMIAEDAGNAGSQEQEALAFVKYTMRPWVRRIEQAISVRLLPPDMKAQGIRARFNLDSLLRGDSATQFRNAVLARTAGTHSIDDIRVNWFDLPAYGEDWSEDPRAPLNSNRAADTVTGGQTAPQDGVAQIVAALMALPEGEQAKAVAGLEQLLKELTP
ncbi:MAG: phage portal protein [Novosphingobium sp.]|uniref:phage portal protein n=1 Tax=Novosphingobium sp. TaxID=1874826 RepID=UPI0027366D92|nr:phage portal protein [Novosphingobium sp.]MDP3550618.1 phage portal protein [Novosphingobium sp.]